jgi:hypothetical protein
MVEVSKSDKETAVMRKKALKVYLQKLKIIANSAISQAVEVSRNTVKKSTKLDEWVEMLAETQQDLSRKIADKVPTTIPPASGSALPGQDFFLTPIGSRPIGKGNPDDPTYPVAF